MPIQQSTLIDVVQVFSDLLRALVDEPDDLSITLYQSPTGQTVIKVAVPAQDMGKLIGVQGRSARALRVLLNALGTAHRTRYGLDIRPKQ